MKYVVFLISLFFLFHKTHAQQSLSKDISQEYLSKLIQVCKTNYPKIKMYQARVDVAETGIRKAKLSYFDIFSFSYLFSPNNNAATVAPTSFGGYQFGFFANVGSLLQKPSVIKQAKGEMAAAQFDKETFDLNMESEVQKRYYTYIQKVAVMRIRSGALLDVETLLGDVKHRFEKGEETLEMYNRVLMMKTDQEQNMINAESEILIAKSSLEEILGQKLETIK